MSAPAIDHAEITLEDIAPPCELQWDEPLRACENSAEWVGLMRCCGSPRILCEEHRSACDWFIDCGHGFSCLTCGSDLDGYVWASLERI